jgi:hypothetical protein
MKSFLEIKSYFTKMFEDLFTSPKKVPRFFKEKPVFLLACGSLLLLISIICIYDGAANNPSKIIFILGFIYFFLSLAIIRAWYLIKRNTK